MVKGEQALILRQTAGKVSAAMNTKPMQAKVAEFTCDTVGNTYKG